MIKLKEDQIREDIIERVTNSEKSVDIQKKWKKVLTYHISLLSVSLPKQLS